MQTAPRIDADKAIQIAARAIDPEIWGQELPLPTRAGVLSWHDRRQRSLDAARRVLAAILVGEVA